MKTPYQPDRSLQEQNCRAWRPNDLPLGLEVTGRSVLAQDIGEKPDGQGGTIRYSYQREIGYFNEFGKFVPK